MPSRHQKIEVERVITEVDEWLVTEITALKEYQMNSDNTLSMDNGERIFRRTFTVRWVRVLDNKVVGMKTATLSPEQLQQLMDRNPDGLAMFKQVANDSLKIIGEAPETAEVV